MSMGLPNAAMTFGKGGRVTILLLLAIVLQKSDTQITCNIEIDTHRGIWRETTPKQATEDQYCIDYRYRETTLQCTSTQGCPQVPNQQGSCTVYRNADTKWPCLATCNECCNHEYKCQTNGVCPCSQNNARYKKAKMCVPYSAVQNCPSNNYYYQNDCVVTPCSIVCPNGWCDTSGHCKCNYGFIQDSKTKICVPYACTQACVGGTCHTYGACTCQDVSVVGPKGGYRCPANRASSEGATHTNHQCSSASCVNGQCVQDGCKCNDGLKADTSKGDGCFPIDCPEQDPTNYCQRKCEGSNCKNNGQCLNDGTCNCNLGYKKSQHNNYQCDQIKCPSTVSEGNNYCKKQRDGSCKNGECDDYGTCNCKEGFKNSSNNPYQCDQIQCPSDNKDDLQYCDAQCRQHCNYGTCSNGGTCTCNEGYMKESNTLYNCNRINCPTRVPKYFNLCQNKCLGSCYNGQCYTDGTCNCNLGFRKSNLNYYQCDRIDCPSKTSEDNSYCKAKCNGNCKNGFCNESGACNCYTGFRKKTQNYYQCDQIQCPSKASEDNSYCKSQCDKSCKNGACDIDGTCSCKEGFKKSPNMLYQCDKIICPSSVQEYNVYCETKCKKFCKNGTCDNLGQCSCNTGYTKDPGRKYKCDKITCPSTASEEWEFCKAVCESQCNDGTCNENGTCNCDDSFTHKNGTCEKNCVTDHDCQAEKPRCFSLTYCITNEEHKTECAETCSSGCDRNCKKCSTSEDCSCENGAKDILTCKENCISSNCEIKEDERKWMALACALIVALVALAIGFGVWICRRRIINARNDVLVTVPEGVEMYAIQDHGRRQAPKNRNCETYLEPRRIGQETGKDGMEYPLYETVADVFPDVEPREHSYLAIADLMNANKGAPARFNVPKEQKEPTYENIAGDVAGAPQETPMYVNVPKEQDEITYENITGDTKAGKL